MSEQKWKRYGTHEIVIEGVVNRTVATFLEGSDRDIALACVNACAGLPDPAAEIARLRGAERDRDAWYACAMTWESLGKALSDKVTNLEAELTKLRTVYAAAVEECKRWREHTKHERNYTFPVALSVYEHQKARAEAGMEEI